MKLKYLLMVAVALLIGFGGIKKTEAMTIDFEGLTDLTPVTNQYSSIGVDFSGATVLTAGISLNEFEFPPYSGSNIVFDDGGPMTLAFNTPLLDFGAYFTYSTPLTLSFYDALNNLEGTVNSAFSNNTALSGDPGSSPNEFLNFVWNSGISSVIIAGDPAGGSFTMDDLTATSVPEPSTLLLLGSGVIGLIGWRKRNKFNS